MKWKEGSDHDIINNNRNSEAEFSDSANIIIKKDRICSNETQKIFFTFKIRRKFYL